LHQGPNEQFGNDIIKKFKKKIRTKKLKKKIWKYFLKKNQQKIGKIWKNFVKKGKKKKLGKKFGKKLGKFFMLKTFRSQFIPSSSTLIAMYI
jgi:hypothetical protein